MVLVIIASNQGRDINYQADITRSGKRVGGERSSTKKYSVNIMIAKKLRHKQARHSQAHHSQANPGKAQKNLEGTLLCKGSLRSMRSICGHPTGPGRRRVLKSPGGTLADAGC